MVAQALEGGISGGARRSKEILIDSANATNPESGGVAFDGLSSLEAISEFWLINNTFAAEYGRAVIGGPACLPKNIFGSVGGF